MPPPTITLATYNSQLEIYIPQTSHGILTALLSLLVQEHAQWRGYSAAMGAGEHGLGLKWRLGMAWKLSDV